MHGRVALLETWTPGGGATVLLKKAAAREAGYICPKAFENMDC